EVPGARVEERTGHRAAGVVDDHVDATERIRAAVDERCDGVVVVDVDRHGDGAAAEAVDLLRHRLQLLFRAGREHDVRTGLRERERARGADPSSCARDDGRPPVDPETLEHQRALPSTRFAPFASSNPWSSVFHDNVAHLMRTGNFTTPCSASRSPSFTFGSGATASPSPSAPSVGRSSDCSWIDIIALKARVRARASSTVLPFTAADIIDADDWLIEQPCPLMRTSATRSPSSTK